MVKMASRRISRDNDLPRPQDIFDTVDFTDTNLNPYRPVGELAIQAAHWLTINKRSGGQARIPIVCRNVDLEGNPVDGKCELCAVGHTARQTFFCNVIDKRLQDNQPRRLVPPTKEERRSGFKVKGSNTWTPVRVLLFPTTVAETWQKLTVANKNKKNEVFELGDKNFGRCLDIAFNKNAKSAANYWTIQKADEPWRKLSPDEAAYLVWNLNDLSKLVPSVKQQRSKLRGMIPQLIDADYSELSLGDEYQAAIDKRRGNDEDDGGKNRKRKAREGSFSVGDDDDDTLRRKRRNDDGDDRVSRRRREFSEDSDRRSKRRDKDRTSTKRRDAGDVVKKKKKRLRD